jgi:hypothetical protein
MKDKQGEVTIVDELYKVLPIWMDRGAPISDTHSNRIIGKGINYSKTVVKNEHGEDLPAIKITGKIYKNYELDNVIWDKIKSKEYKGLSFGGATRSNRTPMKMKDGSMAYALSNLEHYEVAVCKDPAVPMAIITDYNPIAKANYSSSRRDDDKMVIQCTNMGCYVEKADLNESQTFEQKVEALVREGKSRESAEKIVGSFVHKERTFGHSDGKVEYKDPNDKETNTDKIMENAKESAKKPHLKNTSAYQTEAGNDQLGGQGKTEDDKDKREKEDEEKDNDEVKRRDHSDAGGDIHSMYNQNVGREASSGRKLKGDTTANQVGGVRGGLDPHFQGSGETNDINIVQEEPERAEDKGAANIKLVKSERVGDMNSPSYEGAYNEGADDVRENIKYGAPKLTTDLAHKVLGAKKIKAIKYSLEKHAQIQQLKKIKGKLPELGDVDTEDFDNDQTSQGQSSNQKFHNHYDPMTLDQYATSDIKGDSNKLLNIKLRKHAQTQTLKKINNSLGDARGCTEHLHE